MFFNQFNFEAFVVGSIIESTVLFYNKLKTIINLRSLNKLQINKKEINNKLFQKEDFKIDSLYEIYAEVKADIPIDFLRFNYIFKTDKEGVEDMRFKSLMDIPHIKSYISLVKPDFTYNLIKQNFTLNKTKESKKKTKKEIYIFQDCTNSMKDYLEKLKVLKAYILNLAIINNYTVVWLEVYSTIHSTRIFTSSKDVEKLAPFTFISSFINFKAVFQSLNHIKKDIVIISDGEDNFNLDFFKKENEISLIVFNNNLILKNKIRKYGKYYLF